VEVFEHVPQNVCFNLEMKYPEEPETEKSVGAFVSGRRRETRIWVEKKSEEEVKRREEEKRRREEKRGSRRRERKRKRMRAVEKKG
jgi:hypothetical protein